MAFKVFRPGGNKAKHSISNSSPSNTPGTTTGITLPNNSNTGTWMTVPVGKTWMNVSGPIPVIDLELDLEEDRDGLNCKKCNEFYPYAISNQPDNKTLICFACRNGY